MNKKGQDFLNLVEIIVFLFCVFFAFYFLGVAKNGAEQAIDQKIYVMQNDYKTEQQLRTLLQTPIKVDGEIMTFAQSANIYFETFDYIKTNSNILSLDKLRYHEGKLIAHSTALTSAVKTYLAPYINPAEFTTAKVYLKYVIFDSSPYDLFLGEYTATGSSRTTLKQKTSHLSLQIPAYFKHTQNPIGSYYIVLVVGSGIDDLALLQLTPSGANK